jgi:hypothetical protein
MKVVIAGGTGFIGSALIRHLLAAKHSLVLLTRSPAPARSIYSSGNSTSLIIDQWNGTSPGAWTQHLEGADAIINLAGESLAAGRWTKARKERILSSRINATRVIVDAIHQCARKTSVLINASAVGFYGDVPSGDVTEEHPAGKGFLAEVCSRWEDEGRKAESLGMRVVFPRTGIVLDRTGGALAKLALPIKLYVGGPLGSGKQWMPWIHLEDEIRAIVFALENQNITGPINLTAPNPVTNKELVSSIAKVLHRPAWAPAPSFALRLILGEMSEMLLRGQRAIPNKLLQAGFEFKYNQIDQALKYIFG